MYFRHRMSVLSRAASLPYQVGAPLGFSKLTAGRSDQSAEIKSTGEHCEPQVVFIRGVFCSHCSACQQAMVICLTSNASILACRNRGEKIYDKASAPMVQLRTMV